MNIPSPELLDVMPPAYVGRWVPATEALPPERHGVLVMVRGDNCPAYAWLKFAAGDRTCPYFVVPQREAMKGRGTHHGLAPDLQGRIDVTLWYAPTIESLPICPPDWRSHKWGLGGSGWEQYPPEQARTGAGT